MNKFFLIIGGIFFILAVSAASAEKEYILIEIHYENGNFYLVNETLEKGNYPVIEHENSYLYKFDVISDKKETLFTNSFEPDIILSDGLNNFDENFEGGAVKLNETNFFIAVPDIKNSEKIEILKGNEKVFEAKIDYNAPTSCRLR